MLTGGDPASAASLLCALCKESFPAAWELMVHAQAAHMVTIYDLGNKSDSNCSASLSQSQSQGQGQGHCAKGQLHSPLQVSAYYIIYFF